MDIKAQARLKADAVLQSAVDSQKREYEAKKDNEYDPPYTREFLSEPEKDKIWKTAYDECKIRIRRAK